jgi:hypothetical protein
VKNLITAAAIGAMATPALAHLDDRPHLHPEDGMLWGLAAVVALALLWRLRGR